jgi:2-oxo-4-hydroxy-4-carboxy-5-ureidoimidazoline decarboxylase
MTSVLEKINNAEVREAESMFRDCCGSLEWSKRMAISRPFISESALLEKAAAVWEELDRSDWLEAFAGHPRIGESKAAKTQQAKSAEWSKGEQSGMQAADELLKNELAEANQKYFDRFGFIFIVCATGKSANEMLQLCRSRLENDRETEIANAAGEQQKITDLRLKKLLSK